jgi:hypothetical protein
MAKRTKKTDFPFGIYSVKATLDYEDDLDLDHYMNKFDWDKLTDSQKVDKLREIIEENCLGDIDYEHTFDRKTDE